MELAKRFPVLSFIMKSEIPLLLKYRKRFLTLPCSPSSFITRTVNSYPFNPHSMKRINRLTTSSNLNPLPPLHQTSGEKVSRKAKKKERMELPESLLKFKLDMCSRHGKLVEALQLYDEARENGVPLSHYHYNVMLYLCSSAGSGSLGQGGSENDENLKELGMRRGFEIFQQMAIDNVAPNEATFTNAARLATAREDPEMAFDLVKKMKNFGIPPRLRSYGPALFGFCRKGNADKAYEVDEHMVDCGVLAEESELSALLKVSMDAKKADKVYELLHRIRATVRQVSESSAQIVEDWFKSDFAASVGVESWDINKIKEGVVKGGGGWHGQGWLGSGNWRIRRTQMDKKGVCQSCGEKLVCIDIDPKETENFASSLTKLACEKEAKAGFTKFQAWLQKHGPFDAVVDGANAGLVNQKRFNFFQVNFIMNKLREMSPSKRFPLLILHKRRVHGKPDKDPRNQKLLETWENSGALYPTPLGSDDDWYWLYAAVHWNCLLVTNDEMRDHLFQLLGSSFFPRWKEKHQVRISVSKRGIQLHMPPPYSIVIQESENGNWHVPTVTGDDLETPRQWLCATRSKNVSNPLLNLF
ncbi:hypothetical protein ACJRO7_029678 [Eucalyptus globulus]|uniref:ribonuclease P n=1 Tax=Eucalyptus globulus TaxID=34317 RepID=A0ABD3JJZ7_EUCGL